MVIQDWYSRSSILSIPVYNVYNHIMLYKPIISVKAKND